jgi:hypothetical protein
MKRYNEILDWIILLTMIIITGLISHILWVYGYVLFSAFMGFLSLMFFLGGWLHFIGEV